MTSLLIVAALIAIPLISGKILKLIVNSGWPDFPVNKATAHKERKIIQMHKYVPKAGIASRKN